MPRTFPHITYVWCAFYPCCRIRRVYTCIRAVMSVLRSNIRPSTCPAREFRIKMRKYAPTSSSNSSIFDWIIPQPGDLTNKMHTVVLSTGHDDDYFGRTHRPRYFLSSMRTSGSCSAGDSRSILSTRVSCTSNGKINDRIFRINLKHCSSVWEYQAVAATFPRVIRRKVRCLCTPEF